MAIISRYDRISTALDRAGKTQASLAEELGVHVVQLNDVIIGRRPGEALLLPLAEALLVPLRWLDHGLTPPAWVKPEEVVLPPPPEDRTSCRAFVMTIMNEVVNRWATLRTDHPRAYLRRTSMVDPLIRHQLAAPDGPAWWSWTPRAMTRVLTILRLSSKEWEPAFSIGLAELSKKPELFMLKPIYAALQNPGPCCLAVIHARDAFEQQAQTPWNQTATSPLHHSWRVFLEAIAKEAAYTNESLDPVRHYLTEPLPTGRSNNDQAAASDE